MNGTATSDMTDSLGVYTVRSSDRLVGPTQPTSDWSVRPVGPTGRTDCGRTAHICQSNQCGLLADYCHHSCIWQLQLCSYDVSSKYRLRCSMIGRPTGRSVRPVGRSVHTLRQSDRQSDEIKHVWFFRPSVRPVERNVYTIRSSDRPVGQTSRTDRSVRRSYRVNAQ